MRILVSNDDGVDAPGIRVLAEGLRSAGHEVLVVAPDRDRSGASNSLTLDMPIRVVRLGTPRHPAEGLRLGTVRRPPRGVAKRDVAKRDFYDLWLPVLSPSAHARRAPVGGFR